MKRFVVAVSLVLVALSVWAVDCIEYRWYQTGGSYMDSQSSWGSSTAAQCQSAVDWHNANWAASSPQLGPTQGAVSLCNTSQWSIFRSATGNTYTGPMGSRTVTCGPASCSLSPGAQTTHNVTQGYYRSANPTTGVPDLKPDGSPGGSSVEDPPASMCVNSCVQTRGTTVADLGDCWISKTPTATGLYRGSCDWRFTSTATSCTETPAEKPMINPTATVPPCDGSLGYINDKLTCVSKSAPTSGVPPRSKTIVEGNPTAGSSGGSTAPAIPASGSGSNAGGPSSTTDGTRVYPDGTRVTPTPTAPPTGTKSSVAGQEQLACGAPGQPKCAIDETGTPNGAEAYKKSGEEMTASDGLRNSTLASITSASGKDTNWAIPAWAQPQAGCSPWNLGTMPVIDFVILVDMCVLKPYVLGVMNFLWVFGTFLACLGMMGRVMGKGVS
ncbi:hypothetical protein [Caenimonas soli]|uniref:hypothetical protein n=1 Tax=Caenimonas soli TaxID=2735555 RepID=UPI00155780CB|nr:hypothetical protein [Caenimonas soli]NPC57011.1 hypothetical protein [Caenimonas soli]